MFLRKSNAGKQGIFPKSLFSSLIIFQQEPVMNSIPICLNWIAAAIKTKRTNRKAKPCYVFTSQLLKNIYSLI